MKRTIYLLTTLITLFSFNSNAQQPSCGATDAHSRMLLKDPGYAANRAKVDAHAQAYAKKQSQLGALSSGTVLTVPVVVHILHLGESLGTATNITDAQIHSAINALNEDYRKITGTNGDGDGVDIELEFCLAQRDENEQAHSGINRLDASSTADYNTNGMTYGGLSDNEATVKNLSRWDVDQYYNIWVVSEIEGNNGGSGTQGYAYFPGASDSVDGTVVLYNAFGTTGNLKSYTNLNRTLTHELGHGLNLYHTFESGCTNNNCATDGDQCCDTPPAVQGSGCTSTNTCSTDANSGFSSDTTDMIENYMSYNGQACKNMFTEDQKNRMRAVLLSGGVRHALISSDGCDTASTPISDFSAGNGGGCAGTTVQFTDESLNAPTSWFWSFPGGTPDTSNAQNPSITYNSPGVYNVTLTTSNALGTGTTTTKSSYMTIYGNPPSACSASSTVQGNYFGMGIWSVSLSNLTNKTDGTDGDGGYVNELCSQIAYLTPNTMYSMEVVAGAWNTEYVSVYIDYDGNGTLSISERVYNDSVRRTQDGTGMTPHSFTFTTPSSPQTDSLLRMRVMSDFINWSNTSSCQTLNYGQAEDYGVYFGCPANAPVAAGSANLSSALVDQTVTFTDMSTDASGWSWDFGVDADPATASGQGPHYVSYSSTGNKSVKLVVDGACGVQDSITYTNIVNVINGIGTSGTTRDETCDGDDNGAIDLTVIGGSSPFTFAWSNTDNTEDISGLAPGTYYVTVTDSNSLQAIDTFVINGPAALGMTFSETDVSCHGGNDGAIDMTPSGGRTPYQYNWSNTSGTQDITGLTAGTYTVTLTDDSGCTHVDSATVGSPTALSISHSVTDASCYNFSDGEVDVTVSGGTPGYDYSWSNSAMTEDITGLADGQYIVNVTDTNGCTIADTATVNEPAEIKGSFVVTDASCAGGSDGMIDMTPSGGVGVFTGYFWTNSDTTQDIANVGTGFHAVVIWDSTGCTGEDTAFVDEPTALGVSITPTDITCYGDDDGEAIAAVSGGTSPFQYAWNKGTGVGNQVSALPPGYVSLTVTDTNGCMITDSAEIIEPDSISLVTGSSEASFAQSDGMAWVTASGGTPNYTYSWDDNNTQFTDTASGLPTGTYNVTVTDNNGCEQTASVNVGEGPDGIELKSDHFTAQIYPNPVREILNVSIQSRDSETAKIMVYNILGDVITQSETKPAVKHQLQIDLTDQPEGAYLIKVTVGNESFSQKVIHNR